jgi:hypothetical protein
MLASNNVFVNMFMFSGIMIYSGADLRNEIERRPVTTAIQPAHSCGMPAGRVRGMGTK